MPANLQFTKGTGLPIVRGAQGGSDIAAQTELAEAPRYDTWLLEAGAPFPNPLRFFQVPEGRIGSGFAVAKTFAETNMKQVGKLESPIALTVWRPVVSIILTTAPTQALLNYQLNMFQDCLFELEVDGHVELRDHLFWLGGTGLTGIPMNDADAYDGWVSANPSIMGRMDLRIPIAIPSRTNFEVRLIPNQNVASLVGNVPEANYYIKVYLEGNTSRPIGE